MTTTPQRPRVRRSGAGGSGGACFLRPRTLALALALAFFFLGVCFLGVCFFLPMAEQRKTELLAKQSKERSGSAAPCEWAEK